MVKFNGRLELRYWLGTQPNHVAVDIAARSALRVAPAVALSNNTDHAVLSCFRALALASFVSVWPKSRNEEIEKSAQLAIPAVSEISAGSYNNKIARSAAASASAAASTIAFVDGTAASASAAASVEAGSTWQNVSDDAAAIIEGEDVSIRPIWTNEPPPETIADAWALLRINRPPNQNWQVWIDWYEDRLNGFANRPPIMELERERVLIPDDDWKKGPAHVNAIIAEIEANYRDPPAAAPEAYPPSFAAELDEAATSQAESASEPVAAELSDQDVAERTAQSPRGHQFTDDPTLPIDLQASPPTKNAGQVEFHAGLVEALKDVVENSAEYRGNQVPDDLVEAAENLLAAAGDRLDAMNTHRLQRFANRFGRFAETEKQSRQTVEAKIAVQGPEALNYLEDDPRLPLNVGPVVLEAYAALEMLRLGEPKLSQYGDDGSLAEKDLPQLTAASVKVEVVVEQSGAYAAPSVDIIQAENATAKDAVGDASKVGERSVRGAIETTYNGLKTLVRWCWRGLKGVLNGLVELVPKLADFAKGVETLSEYLPAIRAFIEKLPGRDRLMTAINALIALAKSALN